MTMRSTYQPSGSEWISPPLDGFLLAPVLDFIYSP